MSQRLRTDDFDYELPKELIAQRPAPRRDGSRLLIVRRGTGAIEHRRFPDVAGELREGDLLVVNDTKVIPARLMGTRRGTGGKVEALLIEALDEGQRRWSALIKTRGKLQEGEAIDLAPGAALCAVRRRSGLEWEVQIEGAEDTPTLLQRIGLPPLPPYIEQDAARRAEDLARYQTVYADKAGAIAAPTAGLHFTDALLDGVRGRGVQIASVTLHVGLGTFLPVKTDYLDEHPMHAEHFEVSPTTVAAVRSALDERRRIVAVGTTSCRVLESVDWAAGDGLVRGETDLFIYPPYEFKHVAALITNFHLPKSTLLALVCAFAGTELIMQAYAQAVAERYRFYSYGDAMLIV